MPRMVSFCAARDELYRRLCAASSAFEALYPGVRPPSVIKGTPANEPPFYVAVSPMASAASYSGQSTAGHGRVDFTFEVMCLARHVSQDEAADTAMAYADCVCKCVMADARLGGAVDNAFPAVRASGCAPDSSKRHIAAVSVEVRCSVFAKCPDGFREVVR